MRIWTDRPFLRSILGGALGMAAVLLITGISWGLWTIRTDHVTLQAIVRMINEAQAKQAPPK